MRREGACDEAKPPRRCLWLRHGGVGATRYRSARTLREGSVNFALPARRGDAPHYASLHQTPHLVRRSTQETTHTTMRLLLNLIAAAVVGTTSITAAWGAAPWSDKKFVYRAEGKKLAEVLQDFAGSQSIPVVIDAGVEGTVNANFDTRAEEFLKAITKTYGVVWYFDGVTLFIYPGQAMQSQVFRLRGFSAGQVREMLKSFGMGDGRFPLRYNEAEQTLLAYGPPRHIELVATVIQTLEQGSKDRSGNAVRVVPLKFAVAADRVSGATKVQGLATTLNNVFRGGGGSSTGIEGTQAATEAVGSVLGNAEKRRSVEMTYGFKGSKPAADDTRKAEPREHAAKAPGGEAAGKPSTNELPFFEPDGATNAVIIKAPPERMKQYEALVQQLDVAQNLVEIEATIIDVSSDEFDSLGIEWDFSNSRGRIGISPGTPGTPTAIGGAGAATSLVGANITTLLTDAGRQLLTRIRALEGNGKARILARPKVLGAANRTATMVDKRIASVRVAGNLDTNLFTLEAGTTLQVQPQIIPYKDRREVKLTLFIQDGNFESNTVDQIPIIKRTEINTEATIREGESLLIGGISVESETGGRTGIPGLSRVPVVGGLFRNTEGAKYRSERLFLLTPKVIDVEGARAPEGADVSGYVPPAQRSAQAPIEPRAPLPASAVPTPAPTMPLGASTPAASPRAGTATSAVSAAPATPASTPAAAMPATPASAGGDCAASALGFAGKPCGSKPPVVR
jgi:type III secretion protein C